jgi:ribonucleoside-diphosphate reductase alpha chain
MSNLLPTDYQAFIHKSRYAKYFDGKGRESWSETVGRYVTHVVNDVVMKPARLDGVDDVTLSSVVHDIEEAILNLEIMPSMRAMMTAGAALDRDNTAGYNCSYLPVDDPKSFDEAMFILLCGTLGSVLSVSSSLNFPKSLSCSIVTPQSS